MSDDLIKGAKWLKKEILKTDPSNDLKKRRHKKPRLFDYITKEQMIALFENAVDLIEVDNNVKADRIVQILGDKFQELGTGTNRIALMRDGLVFKVALDRRGMIDNLAEYKRSAEVPMYLAKCYETNKVVAISEYVNLITRDEYNENKAKLRTILGYLTSEYVIRDLGLTPKNYCNWGYRDDGSIVALDYAYMYPLKGEGNEKVLQCNCGGNIVIDSTYTSYKCNKCGLQFSPMEILNKMSLDSERMDDEAIYKEAGVDVEEAEIKYGDEFVNYVKIKSVENTEEDAEDKDIANVSTAPINASSLAEVIKSYESLSDTTEMMLEDDDSIIDLEDDDNDDAVYIDEFYNALKAFDSKQ